MASLLMFPTLAGPAICRCIAVGPLLGQRSLHKSCRIDLILPGRTLLSLNSTENMTTRRALQTAL